MAGPNPLLTIGAALAIALAGAVWLADPSARAITTLCKEQTASVATSSTSRPDSSSGGAGSA
jgi:hypothetical protein